ncbi:hypothetical protein NPIL_298241 [Nephila pilipes]|uniref:Uncharacterized protein n=1 Tax=Nephila pilipes TaxID=299642 RepID=A0A8X6JAE2_NEPPI|nr:hypothetical protein NPIL_298241 [Nephila pilipes]
MACYLFVVETNQMFSGCIEQVLPDVSGEKGNVASVLHLSANCSKSQVGTPCSVWFSLRHWVFVSLLELKICITQESGSLWYSEIPVDHVPMGSHLQPFWSDSFYGEMFNTSEDRRNVKNMSDGTLDSKEWRKAGCRFSY